MCKLKMATYLRKDRSPCHSLWIHHSRGPGLTHVARERQLLSPAGHIQLDLHTKTVSTDMSLI